MVGRRKNRSNIIQSSDEGEAFDLNVPSSTDDDVGPPARSDHSRSRAAPAVEPNVVAPIAPTFPAAPVALHRPKTGSSRSNQAQDVNYFYSKREIDVSGVMTLRRVCTLCM
jgi:hypothetical protein